MDFFVASQMASEEPYSEYAPYQHDTPRRVANVLARFTPSLVLGVLASWLAWSANKGMDLPARLAMSALGFLFGGLYLIWFALFKKCK